MSRHTISENLTRLVNVKTAISNAITAKGGTVGTNDGLEEFANDIATIPTGSSTVGVLTIVSYGTSESAQGEITQ